MLGKFIFFSYIKRRAPGYEADVTLLSTIIKPHEVQYVMNFAMFHTIDNLHLGLLAAIFVDTTKLIVGCYSEYPGILSSPGVF